VVKLRGDSGSAGVPRTRVVNQEPDRYSPQLIQTLTP
jgi:hypothetical protein